MKINNYSEKELEILINKNFFLNKGLAPWYNWESENSSFGKTIRYFSGYPKLLPLMVNSDHAVHSESKLWNNELSTDLKIPFLTWNYTKYLKFKKIKKNVYYVYNPCSYYLNTKKIKNKKSKKKGTLIFYPHSNLSSEPIIDNDKYFKKLKALPDKFKPLNIMLSFHDIKNKKYLSLLKYKLPIFTAGNTNSSNFIDNFYEILKDYEYATAPITSHSIGSSFFYSVDIGVKYFFYYQTKFRIFKSNENIKKKIVSDSDYLDINDKKKIRELQKSFSLKNFEKIKNPKIKIKKFMGYNSKISRIDLFIILIGSLIYNIDKVFVLYFKNIKKFFFKLIRF